jgi:hypothetical protein
MEEEPTVEDEDAVAEPDVDSESANPPPAPAAPPPEFEFELVANLTNPDPRRLEHIVQMYREFVEEYNRPKGYKVNGVEKIFRDQKSTVSTFQSTLTILSALTISSNSQICLSSGITFAH